jgi:hypothetical protein
MRALRGAGGRDIAGFNRLSDTFPGPDRGITITGDGLTATDRPPTLRRQPSAGGGVATDGDHAGRGDRRVGPVPVGGVPDGVGTVGDLTHHRDHPHQIQSRVPAFLPR